MAAQDTDAARSVTDRPAEIHESLPRIVYIYNQQGEPIPWIDFPWEQFNDLTIEDDGEANSDPYVVTDVVLDAQAEEDYLTIAATLNIQVFNDAQIRVPLGMRRCHFLSQPKITSGQVGVSAFIRFDEEGDEYQLLIDGKKGLQLSVDFSTRLALNRVGNRTFFRLGIPRWPSARLTVKTAESGIVAGVTRGMTVQTVPPTNADGEVMEGTTFQVDGLLPYFEFWWQPQQVAEVQEAFSVEGDIEVVVDRLGEVSSVATLSLSSFNKPIDGFIVQLPKNTRWSPDDAVLYEEYSISVTERREDRETLQVVFDEPAIKPPDVRLQVETDRKSGPTDAATAYEINGFNVLHAVSQYGNVRIFSESDWTLEFRFGDFVRQTNEATEPAEKTFAYSRPDQLSMVVTRQVSELIVEPIYVVDVEETVARLTAIFRCTRRGARQGNLSINLGPWIYQSLRPDPENVKIDAPDLLSPTKGRLDIPLTISSDRFEVILNASLPIENGLATRFDEGSQDNRQSPTRLAFDFPVPIDANVLLQATVALQTDKTIAVNTGVAPEYSEVNMPERLRAEFEPDTNALCLRMRAAGKPATLPVFAARLARSTFVDIETEIIDIIEERIRIRQQMRWQVSGVPLTRALLTVNQRIWEFGDLEVQVNGRPTVCRPFLIPSFGDAATDENVTIEVPIEPQNLGAFDIVVTYDWANWLPGGQVESWQNLDSVDIDLALPRKFSSNGEGRLDLSHGFRAPRIAGYKVSLNEVENGNISWPWTRDFLSPDWEATSETKIDFLPLIIERDEMESQPKRFEELVDRAWFQTWCTDQTRVDRAVFRVQGGDEDLEIIIPDSAANKLNVWVDSKLTLFRKTEANLITVDVDATKPTHVVELHYSLPRGTDGKLKASLPSIADAEILGQWYWHIVMPRSECMVAWPRNLTRAHHWDWSSLIPRRESEMSIAELEEWSGGNQSGSKVLAGSSQYLFGAMGEPGEQLVLRTAPLPIYFLAMAGTVFIAGILLIYTKRPLLVLLALGLTILALIFLNPAYASLAGQVVAFGIVLVLLGQILAWLVRYSPQPKLTTIRSSSTWIRGSNMSRDSKQSSASSIAKAATGSSRFRGAQ